MLESKSFSKSLFRKKSHVEIGATAESWFTISLHQEKERIPVLFSSLVMRRQHLKQIDASSFSNNRVVLWEIKYSQGGEILPIERLLKPCEYGRWLRTKNYLMNLLGFVVEVQIVILSGDKIIHFVKNQKLL